MKNIILIIAVYILNSCSPNQKSLNMEQVNDSLTVKDVEIQVDRLQQALLKPDPETLEDLTSASLTYGHSVGLIEDRKAFIESLMSKKFCFTDIDRSEQTVYIEGNTAIVRHTLFCHTADLGKQPGTVTLKVLTVWQKTDGAIRLIARQAIRL